MNDSDLREIHERLAALEQRLVGLYPALVIDDADPLHRGRLRLLVPEVLGDVATGWAEPVMPFGSAASPGAPAVPTATRDADGNPTTGVWVSFRGGDVRFPQWLGAWSPAPRGGS